MRASNVALTAALALGCVGRSLGTSSTTPTVAVVPNIVQTAKKSLALLTCEQLDACVVNGVCQAEDDACYTSALKGFGVARQWAETFSDASELRRKAFAAFDVECKEKGITEDECTDLIADQVKHCRVYCDKLKCDERSACQMLFQCETMTTHDDDDTFAREVCQQFSNSDDNKMCKPYCEEAFLQNRTTINGVSRACSAAGALVAAGLVSHLL